MEIWSLQSVFDVPSPFLVVIYKMLSIPGGYLQNAVHSWWWFDLRCPLYVVTRLIVFLFLKSKDFSIICPLFTALVKTYILLTLLQFFNIEIYIKT